MIMLMKVFFCCFTDR